MGSPLSILLEALTYGAMALLAWKGRTPERLVLAGLLALQFGSPILDHLTIGSFRWAVAGLSLGMFGLLTGLALVYQRWWLMLAAGAQLIALSTHFAALGASQHVCSNLLAARHLPVADLDAIQARFWKVLPHAPSTQAHETQARP